MIGPKGNAINEILQDTGVFVEMPSSDSPSETITLRGPQEKLGLGESLINVTNRHPKDLAYFLIIGSLFPSVFEIFYLL